MLAITSPVELADLLPSNGGDGSMGIVIDGVAANDFVGDVSHIGDMNGDGFDDFAIGTADADPGGNQSGAAYVVFGQPTGLPAQFNVSSLDGTNGFLILGVAATDLTGRDLGGGDVNGDGFDDLIVALAGGDPGGSSDVGQTMVVFGSATSFPATMDVNSLDGSNGFVINGEADGDFSGFTVASAGDTNGDGLQDILIGAYLASPGGTENAGRAYVVFGNSGGFGSTVLLSTLDGINGFKLSGENQTDYAGFHVSGAGDVNGDGLDDVLVAAIFADPGGRDRAGQVYVVYGQSAGHALDFALSTIDGTNGFVIEGDRARDELGRSMAPVGDFNGDGLDDFVVGTPEAAGNGITESGDVYLVFGNESFPASMRADEVGSTYGLFFGGIDQIDELGHSVGPAGDTNGDGYDDLIMSAYTGDGTNNARQFSGESYVIFGTSANLPGGVDLSSLDGTQGFALHGVAAGDGSGKSVSGGGDINGDGFTDILIGARFGGPTDAGQSYFFNGGDHTDSVTHLGTAGNDLLTGDGLANVMIGGTGDDTLDGLGGFDVLRGGAGDDTLVVPDASFFRVFGGNGHDTLRWDTADATLDLTDMSDNRLLDLEQIDLAGSNATLLLSVLDVLNLSDDSNTLLVTGDDTDSVPVSSAWTFVDVETIGMETFDVYRSGEAYLKIDQDIGSSPPMPGDFDFDGDLDCADIDALIIEKISGNNSAEFDLNADGFVDIGDMNVWVLTLKGTLFGDANFDYAVDVSDFSQWNGNKFTSNVSWCGGNFNGDTVTDVSDFSVWSANKFTSVTPPGMLGPVDTPTRPIRATVATGTIVENAAQTSEPPTFAPQLAPSRTLDRATSETPHKESNKATTRIIELVFAADDGAW